jgi:hypothetical protein
MKKILTLLFAVVTVAAFAAPTAQKAKKLQPQKSEAKIEMQAKMGAPYTGKTSMMKDFTSGVDTMYLTPVGTFYSSFFPYDGSLLYSYNMALIPTNVETTWMNISTGIASDTYDWVYYNPSIDEEYLTQVEGQKDLVCTFPNYPGGWVAPRLYANAYEENADYYSFGGAVQYGGKFEQDVLGDGTTMTNMYQFSPRADYYEYFSTGGCSAGMSEDHTFYTNMVNRYVPEADFAEIVNFVQIFNYPGKPYTFSRIQLYCFANAQAGQTLTAKVCKVEDGLIDMDNPIAEAVYEFPANDLGEDAEAIDFYFEKEDPELGLTEEDWLTIDTDIAIVISGVDKLQDVTPLLCALQAVADDAHPEFYDNQNGGYAQWDYSANGEVIDSRFHSVHCGWYWGSGDDSSLPINMLLSINAQMAYIETKAESASELILPVPTEATTYTVELKASEPYDAWVLEGEIPEWMTIEAEDIMEEDQEGNLEYTGYTTLTVNVQPNNNGEVVYTLPGTQFKLIIGEGGPVVVPGDVDGDGFVTAGDITLLYNVMLNNDYTGVVNGDQDGDGNITAGDVTFIYNILLGSE